MNFRVRVEPLDENDWDLSLIPIEHYIGWHIEAKSLGSAKRWATAHVGVILLDGAWRVNPDDITIVRCRMVHGGFLVILQTGPLLTDIQRRNLNTVSWLYNSAPNAAQSGRTFLIAVRAVVHATEHPDLPVKVVDHVWDDEQDERVRAMLKYVLKRLDALLADGTNRFRHCFKIFKSTRNGPPAVVYDGKFNLDTEETDDIPDLVAAAEFYYDYRDATWEPIVPDVDVERLPPIPPRTPWGAIRTWWMDLLWEYPDEKDSHA